MDDENREERGHETNDWHYLQFDDRDDAARAGQTVGKEENDCLNILKMAEWLR